MSAAADVLRRALMRMRSRKRSHGKALLTLLLKQRRELPWLAGRLWADSRGESGGWLLHRAEAAATAGLRQPPQATVVGWAPQGWGCDVGALGWGCGAPTRRPLGLRRWGCPWQRGLQWLGRLALRRLRLPLGWPLRRLLVWPWLLLGAKRLGRSEDALPLGWRPRSSCRPGVLRLVDAWLSP